MFSGMADPYDMLHIVVIIDVLHFCTEAGLGWIFEARWLTFGLQMDVTLETLGYFWEVWGVLFLMVFFGVHFWGPSKSKGAESSDLLEAGAHQERP